MSAPLRSAIRETSSGENFKSWLVIKLRFPRLAYLANEVVGVTRRMITKWTLSGRWSINACEKSATTGLSVAALLRTKLKPPFIPATAEVSFFMLFNAFGLGSFSKSDAKPGKTIRIASRTCAKKLCIESSGFIESHTVGRSTDCAH